MPEDFSRLPTVRLRDDEDEDIRTWLRGLDNKNKSGTIREALRYYIATGNGQTPDQHEESEDTEDATDDLAAGEAWLFELIRDRSPEMATPSINALASSPSFRDIARALDALEHFFDSRDSYNEMILSPLYLACNQLLHRIAERRRELAPEDRRRMQELAEKDLDYLTPPDIAVELVKRAETLYDQDLDYETRSHLIQTMRSSFSRQDQ